MNENIDTYVGRKSDLRKVLKSRHRGRHRISGQTPRPSKTPRIPRKKNPKQYEFLLSTALETLDSSAQDHRQLMTEQEEAAKEQGKEKIQAVKMCVCFFSFENSMLRAQRFCSVLIYFRERRHSRPLPGNLPGTPSRAPIPELKVDFFAFTSIKNTIRMREGKLLVRLSDLLEGAPAPVLQAIAHILLAKMYRKPIEREAAARYRRYVSSQDITRKAHLVRQIRGRKHLHSAQGRTYDLDASLRISTPVFSTGFWPGRS